MRNTALIFALIAAASVVGFAKYREAAEPGADIRHTKTAFVKIQSRLCAFDATDTTGCERPEAE